MSERIRLLRLVAGVAFAHAIGCGTSQPDPLPSGGSTSLGGATTTSGGAASGGTDTTMGGASMGGASMGGASTSMGGGGTSAGMTGAGGSGRPSELPPGETQDALAAFLKAGAYKNAPWIAETPMPRDQTPGSQHGSKVRVWENPTLVAALAAGHDGYMGNPYPEQWSMAVKELYDDTGATMVGVAAAIKQGTTIGPESWTYYCYGPGMRCNSIVDPPEANPIYGTGMSTNRMASDCGFCHGGTIFTKAK